MSLNSLPKICKNSKRVGRGRGSGKGKTCGSGMKGQKARSGVSIKGFEGGQQPLYTRLPKRGFVSRNRISYKILSLKDISKYVEEGKLKAGEVVDNNFLQSVGFIKKVNSPVKMLSNGADSFSTSFTLKINACSNGAKEAIEKAGGTVEIVKSK